MFLLDSLFEDKIDFSQKSKDISGVVADEIFSRVLDIEDSY